MPEIIKTATNFDVGVSPSKGLYWVSEYLLLIKYKLCAILAAILIQLASIKPTGPKILVSTYEMIRNMMENTTIR